MKKKMFVIIFIFCILCIAPVFIFFIKHGRQEDGFHVSRAAGYGTGMPETNQEIKGNDRIYSIRAVAPTRREMIVTSSDDSHIDIYSLLFDGCMILTRFEKKPWGTYNIAGQFFCSDTTVPASDPVLMAGGGTDWEYVLMAGDRPENIEFSGGNHGNEIMEDIKITGDFDQELTLGMGGFQKHKSLKIEENTRLTTQSNPSVSYCNVKRVYTVTPSGITLDSRFEFTEDIYLGTSYVCMFPIVKNFGRYAYFVDNGEMFETPPEGETLSQSSSPNYYGKLETLSVEVWGCTGLPISYYVKIKDREMVDNFRNPLKVFYWDLNTQCNKLYFSKYDDSKPTLIKKGTVWENSSAWEIRTEI